MQSRSIDQTNSGDPAYGDLARTNVRSLERALALSQMVIAKMQAPPDDVAFAQRMQIYRTKDAEVADRADEISGGSHRIESAPDQTMFVCDERADSVLNVDQSFANQYAHRFAQRGPTYTEASRERDLGHQPSGWPSIVLTRFGGATRRPPGARAPAGSSMLPDLLSQIRNKLAFQERRASKIALARGLRPNHSRVKGGQTSNLLRGLSPSVWRCS
jgi:hypothetical protein